MIFGLGHLLNPFYFAVATLSGAAFGYLFIASGDLMLPLITHTIYDAVVVMAVHLECTDLSKKEQEEILCGELDFGDR